MEPKRTGMVYFSEENCAIVEYLTEDGLSWVFRKTQEEIKQQYGNVIVISEKDAIKKTESILAERYKDSLHEISEDTYYYYLEVLPTVEDWVQKAGESSFKMSEHQSENWTRIVVDKGDKYYTFIGNANMTHEQIMAKVENHM